MMKFKKIQKYRGFTLIELLVSIALFSVVLTVTLGSIMTIADSNKKSRSLMSVTNNLNFAIDSMVRSFKSGEAQAGAPVYSSAGKQNNCFSTEEVDYDTNSTIGINSRRQVDYCWIVETINGEEKGKITKNIEGDSVDLTSPDVDIDYLKFEAPSVQDGVQPILTIMIEGKVKVSEKISSQFFVQTSVSQRRLNI